MLPDLVTCRQQNAVKKSQNESFQWPWRSLLTPAQFLAVHMCFKLQPNSKGQKQIRPFPMLKAVWFLKTVNSTQEKPNYINVFNKKFSVITLLSVTWPKLPHICSQTYRSQERIASKFRPLSNVARCVILFGANATQKTPNYNIYYGRIFH